MPRPKLKPTEEQRRLVKQLSAVGVPQKDIGRKMGIRSPKTIRKYFRNELDLGQIDANAAVATSLFQKAREGNVDAQKYWMQHRAGWGNHNLVQMTTAVPPFIVARDESSPPI